MTKYVIKKCKSVTWISLFVIILNAINVILGNYIYKFIGFVIDYGLNYSGEKYSGELAFLFSGSFGDYGSLKLIISLSIAMVVSALISYIAILLSYYIQKKGYFYASNKMRVDFFRKSKGKKLPFTNGDMVILLNEDIYEVANIFTYYYPTIISSVLSILYTIFMLNSISSYLLITPVVLSPILVYFMIKYHKETYKQNTRYRAIEGELRECINKATGSNDEERYKEFKKLNNQHTNERQKVSGVSNKYSTIINLIKLMIYIISCTVAGVLAINGKILIGEYLIFTTFINTIFTQIVTLINHSISIKSAQPRVEKVKSMEEYLNEQR